MPAFLLPMLLKGFGFVKQAFQAALGFVTKHPWQAALIAALCVCAWLWRANNGLHESIKAERARYAETVASFKKAQADAEALQAHNLARVAKIQEEINNETIDNYRGAVDGWKSRFDRLRANINRSSPCNTGLPAVPNATEGVDAANPDTSITAVKIDDLETLVQNSVRGKALQDWVSRQAKVNTSPEFPQ